MAKTVLANINTFEKATKEVFGKLKITSDLLSSGLVKGDSTLRSKISSEGTGVGILLPFIKRGEAKTWSMGTDDGTEIVDQNIQSGQGIVYATYLNLSIGGATILKTVEKTGISVERAAYVEMGDAYKEMKETRLISLIEGVVGSARDSALGVTNDLGATVLTFKDIVNTEAMAYNDVEYIVMNKVTKAHFVNDKSLVYLPADKSINQDFETIDGKSVLISSKFADGEVAMFEKGAVIDEDIDPANGTFEYDYNAKANQGSGSESFLMRTVNVMLVEGFSFTGTPASKFGITDVEFATAGNHTFEAGSKNNCPFVVLTGALA